MEWGYCDLLDIVTFEEEVTPCLVLCFFVRYNPFKGSELTNYLLAKDGCYFFLCTLF